MDVFSARARNPVAVADIEHFEHGQRWQELEPFAVDVAGADIQVAQLRQVGKKAHSAVRDISVFSEIEIAQFRNGGDLLNEALEIVVIDQLRTDAKGEAGVEMEHAGTFVGGLPVEPKIGQRIHGTGKKLEWERRFDAVRIFHEKIIKRNRTRLAMNTMGRLTLTRVRYLFRHEG